jgi:hypothetical protein
MFMSTEDLFPMWEVKNHSSMVSLEEHQPLQSGPTAQLPCARGWPMPSQNKTMHELKDPNASEVVHSHGKSGFCKASSGGPERTSRVDWRGN